MRGRPADYLWLTGPRSPVAVAGCITVVSAATVAQVAGAFGVEDPLDVLGPQSADVTLSAAFADLPNGCVIVEIDGFQGSRVDVLKNLSRISAQRAASVFWNVNGLVTFGCAQGGKVVAAVDLGARDEVSRLPASLRRLVSAAPDEADLVALAAAMAVQFTGISFSNEDIEAARRFLISPPPPLGGPDDASSTPLQYEEPQLTDRIARLSPREQRELAEWVASTLVDAAGAESEAGFRAILINFGKQDPARVPPESSTWFARLEREIVDEEARQDEEGISVHLRRLFQLHWTVSAVEYACHPDAQTAAWRAVYAAHLALANAQLIDGHPSVEEFNRQLDAKLH